MAGFGTELSIYRGPTGVTDVGLDGNDGTYNGGMGVVANTESGGVSAFDFQGTNDYINIGNISTATKYAIGFWIKFGTNPSNKTVNYPIGMGASTGVFWGGSWSNISDSLGLYSGSSDDVAESTFTADQGTWHHVVVLVDGMSATFYVDGVDKGTDTATKNTELSGVNIGRRPDGFWYITGLMDDIRFEDDHWTPTQISDWYTAGRGYDASPATVTRRRRRQPSGIPL